MNNRYAFLVNRASVVAIAFAVVGQGRDSKGRFTPRALRPVGKVAVFRAPEGLPLGEALDANYHLSLALLAKAEHIRVESAPLPMRERMARHGYFCYNNCQPDGIGGIAWEAATWGWQSKNLPVTGKVVWMEREFFVQGCEAPQGAKQ